MEGYLSIPGSGRKMGRVGTAGLPVLRPGAYSWGDAVRGCLGHSRKSGKAGGFPEGRKAVGNPPEGIGAFSNLMPLLNTSFAPGECLQAIREMEIGPKKNIALAEYHYFTGQAEKTMKETERHLTVKGSAIRLSACWLYAFACLTMGRPDHARHALREIKATLEAGGEAEPSMRAAQAFVAFGAVVLLHLPLPEEMPPAEDFLPLLPPGLRAFALYEAHYLYLKGEYGHSVGVVEATLAMGAQAYPISAIYLHLVGVMSYMSLKQTERARDHLLAAWELARPDDLIEGFGEHHGLLGAMLEATIKPEWPEDFKRIIATGSPPAGAAFTTRSPDTMWQTT